MFLDGLSNGWEKLSLLLVKCMKEIMKSSDVSVNCLRIPFTHDVKRSENFRSPSESPSTTLIDFSLYLPKHRRSSSTNHT